MITVFVNENTPIKEPETRMGRPRKREVAVVEIADSLGIQLSADILTLDDMKDFPDISGETPRDQSIMMMYASGMPQSHIGSAFKIDKSRVNRIVKRIDPGGVFKINPKAKKAIITKLAEGRALSAISSITLEDLLELDADKRTSVAAKMIKISQELNATKHKGVGASRMAMLNEQLEAEAVEGEFEELGN